MVVNLGGRRRKGEESKGEGEGGRREERGRREKGRREGGERKGGERERKGGERKGGNREDYPFPTRLVATSTQQAANERTMEKKHGSTTDLPLLSNTSKHCVCVTLS